VVSDDSEANNVGKRPNHLISEKSPYLLQHAYNPVDWYPWGLEAFERARRENKLVFLSIGYSTCHWCHVMKRESFEDPEVARLMNEAFVSIKVDREERPDIDNLYMTVCQVISGNCGWPLTIIMTPDKKPFFAGTYFPKETRSGHVGMLELIPKIEELWMTRAEDVFASADQITETLLKTSRFQQGEELGRETLRLAYEQLLERFDEQNGGFGGAPKFPTAHNLLFLLRYWRSTRDKKALQMVEKSLQSMQRGGIYDHVGFGFHRYSTDSRWLVPHFEKMLYDQALVAISYMEAYQATRKQEYRDTAQEIFAYVLRDMKSPDGGFYSAEDAQSEGEEGKFYLWTTSEIQDALGKEAPLACKVFDIEKAGNFTEEASGKRTGSNILHLAKPLSDLAYELRIPEVELRARAENIRQKLLAAREKRIRPHKDDKILTDLNGLIIAALARGAQIFNENTYVEAARNALHFILKNMRKPDGRLFHRYRDGESAVPGYVDDYAFLIWGLIELYEATFDSQYLQLGLELNNDLTGYFWDDDGGGFYFTAADSEPPLMRRKEIHDGAIPSGNSISILNLLRLARMTANPELGEKSNRIVRVFSSVVKQFPASFTQFLVGLDFSLEPSLEVVIAGNSHAKDTEGMLNILRTEFLPNKVVLLNPTEQESSAIFQIAEFVKDQPSINGKATAYVCVNNVCKQPTTDPVKLKELLNATTQRDAQD